MACVDECGVASNVACTTIHASNTKLLQHHPLALVSRSPNPFLLQHPTKISLFLSVSWIGVSTNILIGLIDSDRQMSLSEKQEDGNSKGVAVIDTADGSSPSLEQPNAGLINASGHVQELQRHFSLLSLCSVAITTGNTWVAIGGGIVSRLLLVVGNAIRF